jgi:hypothetical protein
MYTVTDPIGPGTPAWTAFDNALAAHREWRETHDKRRYKRYWNQRSAMVTAMRRHRTKDCIIQAWIAFLKREISAPVHITNAAR